MKPAVLLALHLASQFKVEWRSQVLRILRITALALAFSLPGCESLCGQNAMLTGSVGGRITDPSGAAVLGASVVLQSLATGLQQSVETNRSGLYRFPVVTPGNYSIAATSKGFRGMQFLTRVLVGNNTRQDMVFRIGSSAEKIQVNGNRTNAAARGILGKYCARPIVHRRVTTEWTALHRLHDTDPKHHL